LRQHLRQLLVELGLVLLQRRQLGHDLWDFAHHLCIAVGQIARWRQVVVVLLGLRLVDHGDQAVQRLAFQVRASNTTDGVFGKVVFRVALAEFAAGVDQHDLALAILWLVPAQHHDDAGGGGVVEQVVGQQDHAVDQVVFDEPAADVAFLVLVLAAAAAGDRTGVEYHGGAAVVAEAGDGVLQPGPVGLAGGDAAGFLEAVEWVVVVDGRVEALVPHRVGDDQVEALQRVAVAVLGVAHGVAAQYLTLHVVDDAVHAGDRVAGAGEFLAVELERDLAERVEPAAHQLQFDQQAEAAAGVVVSLLAGARAQDFGHQETDFARSEELARALALAFGELAQQVLVAAAEEIRLHVVQAEPVTRVAEGFDDALERLVRHLALAVAGFVEIHGVDDAGQVGIGFHQ